MADVIQFPSAAKMNSNSKRDFIEQFDKIIKEAPAGALKDVQSHETLEAISLPNGLMTVPDIASGGKRNPRWGVNFAFSVMPELDRSRPGPMILPPNQSRFFASDDLDAVKDRIIFEVEKAVKLAKLAVSDPEGFEAFERSMLEQHLAQSADNDANPV